VCFKNCKTGCLYDNSSFCSELVKTTVKCDRLPWPKFSDENLKSQPKEFWNCVQTDWRGGGEADLLHLQIYGIS
jgi:hypothetical protein